MYDMYDTNKLFTIIIYFVILLLQIYNNNKFYKITTINK